MLLEGKNLKGYIVPLQVFSYCCFFKTQSFLLCFNQLKMCFSFSSPLSPLPVWLVGWSIFMFLNFNSMALSLYCLLKGLLPVTSCSSYRSLFKTLDFFNYFCFFRGGSLEGCLLLISLIWKRRTKTIWMSYNEIYLLKFFYVLLYHYSCLILHSVKWHNHRLLWF